MSTSATTAAASMAFPKYPELPPELRLRIIEETLDPLFRIGQQCRLSEFACIDREWNRVVELRIFKDIKLCPQRWYHTWTSSAIQQELIDFGAICGKRSGRVSRILLRFYDCDRAPSDNHPHLHILFQLFNLMKDWTHGDREQQGLIELTLNFQSVEDPLSWRPEGPCDLGKFPQVPVIGSIHEPRPGYHSVRLHPCILAALCQKLPNVRHASLTLPYEASEYVSTENFIDAMDSLRVHKPGLTHLDLRAPSGEPWDVIQDPALLPINQCLNASPSSWNDRLVSLKIHRNIIVQDFLRDASKTMWPNLKTIKLVGEVALGWLEDGSQMDEDNAAAVAENGSEVIGALIMAVPSMPKATKFRIRMNFQEGFPKKAFEVSIHLGNVTRTKNTTKPLPCVDTFVPSSNNGVAKVDGVSLPGDLAAQLQDVVRYHRRQELEVFICTEDRQCYDQYYAQYYDQRPHSPCVQWNRQTDSWEPAFRNGLDIFMYEIGQYWEAVDQMDGPW